MSRSSRTLLTLAVTIGGLLATQAYAFGQRSNPKGAVFVMTNAAHKNEVISYWRGSDGALQYAGRTFTGGRGSGGTTDPLQSQGSLTLTTDHSFLLAVNAGSGSISVFQVHGAHLSLLDRAPSGGSSPVAVAEHNGVVYVLNAGGNDNVAGFWLEGNGHLRAIPGSIRLLSSNDSGGSSLAFSPDGQFLAVTERLTNKIDIFRAQADHTLSAITTSESAGAVPFAAAFAPNGALVVAEASGGVSSYAVGSDGTLTPISTSVPTLGAATCWNLITPDGHITYTSNAGSANLSGFTIGADGTITAIGATIVGANPAGSTNLDIASSADSRFVYTLNSGTGTVGAFSVQPDGSLTSIGGPDGLPATSGLNGIAAF